MRLADRTYADEDILCGSKQLRQCCLKPYPGIMSGLLPPDLGVSLSLLPLLAGRSDVRDEPTEEGCSHGRGDYRPRIWCQMHGNSMARCSDIPHDLESVTWQYRNETPASASRLPRVLTLKSKESRVWCSSKVQQQPHRPAPASSDPPRPCDMRQRPA